MTEEIIRARIDSDLKTAFERACKANDRTASQVLRDLIRFYVQENSGKKAQGELLEDKPKPMQKTPKRKSWK